MNEITRIHLGRQPFTISVEAHHELKAYLAQIQKEVADQEVVNEVELRMSELLLERGITEQKVILIDDVHYLQEQLGKPEDFSDASEADAAKEDEPGTKRLFRDADNAMIAGVAAGIANYFGVEPVVVRLIFILLAIFGGGSGIIIYILLWLVVPPAVTASERLQMRGKSVTLEALKDSVANANVSATARRMNTTMLGFINSTLRVIVKLAGLGFILSGLGILFGVAVMKAYMLLHNGQLFQENLFPVGLREQWLLALGMILAVIVALFLLLIGIATFKRKWPVRGWITGLLVGLFLIGSAASLALAADAAPRIQERYETSLHTTAVKNIQPFTRVVTNGSIDIVYISSPNYAVNVHYFGNPDLSKVKINVSNDTLYVDSTALDNTNHCTMLCLFPGYDMTVQVYAPNIEQFIKPPSTDIFYPSAPSLN